MTNKTKKPVIICGGQTGRAVIFGWVDEIPEVNQTFEAHDARMVLYWPAECKGLLGLAADGPKRGIKLTSTVPFVRDTCRQVIAVTKDAAKELKSWAS